MNIFKNIRRKALLALIGKSRAEYLSHLEHQKFERVQLLYQQLFSAGKEKIAIMKKIDDLNYAIAVELSDEEIDISTALPLEAKQYGFKLDCVGQEDLSKIC